MKLAGGFSKIGQTTSHGLILPVLYVAVVAVGIWYLLEHTATGRRLYAVGFNPDAARLAGVKVRRLQFLALVTSGRAGGSHGHRARRRSSAVARPRRARRTCSPAFAAVFLGATQLKNGRFNAGGTLIAVLLLGTGTTGLGLANAPQWSGSLFVGVVLIAALTVTGLQRRTTLAARPTTLDDTSVQSSTAATTPDGSA